MRYRPIVLGVALAAASVSASARQAAPAPAQSPPAAAPAAAATSQAFDPGIARRITVEEIKKRMDAGQKVIIIDTRGKFVGPFVKGATHVTAQDLDTWAKDVPKDAFIVAYCT
jgi:hypothetical protein